MDTTDTLHHIMDHLQDGPLAHECDASAMELQREISTAQQNGPEECLSLRSAVGNVGGFSPL